MIRDKNTPIFPDWISTKDFYCFTSHNLTEWNPSNEGFLWTVPVVAGSPETQDASLTRGSILWIYNWKTSFQIIQLNYCQNITKFYFKFLRNWYNINFFVVLRFKILAKRQKSSIKTLHYFLKNRWKNINFIPIIETLWIQYNLWETG